MARIWELDPAVQRDAAAMVADDQPDEGRVVVTWMEHGEATDAQCDGWIDGDLLFVPFDGQSLVGSNFDDDGMPEGAWYEVTSGQEAIRGLPGAPLATLL